MLISLWEHDVNINIIFIFYERDEKPVNAVAPPPGCGQPNPLDNRAPERLDKLYGTSNHIDSTGHKLTNRHLERGPARIERQTTTNRRLKERATTNLEAGEAGETC